MRSPSFLTATRASTRWNARFACTARGAHPLLRSWECTRSTAVFTPRPACSSDRLGASRIRVNNLLPGFLENWEWSDELMAGIPLGRPGKLREIAGTAAFLLSDEAGYITGQDVVVDGGATRGV